MHNEFILDKYHFIKDYINNTNTILSFYFIIRLDFDL